MEAKAISRGGLAVLSKRTGDWGWAGGKEAAFSQPGCHTQPLAPLTRERHVKVQISPAGKLTATTAALTPHSLLWPVDDGCVRAESG